MLFVYLSASHFSHYLLMLWRGCRYYDDWRPKIVSAHPCFLCGAVFFSYLPAAYIPTPPNLRLYCSLYCGTQSGGALSLSFSLTLPFSSLHPISPCKDCIQIHFIGSLCFHGNFLKPWQLFEPSQTLFQNCCIHCPLSLSLTLRV